MLTRNSEWLFLTFFPQEDENELNRLRANLTPFLKAVTKALSVELELFYIGDETKNDIIDEIIQKIPPQNSTATTCFFSGRNYNTLHEEFDGLLNLR